VQRIDDVAAQAKRLLLTITQNPLNDQDDNFLTDVLRERMQVQLGYIGSSFGPITQAQAQQNEQLHALTNERLNAMKVFETTQLAGIDGQLRALKLQPLTKLTKQPAVYNPGSDGDSR
jgi:hypothetical protein